jgi:hypothetical protein
VLSAISYTGEDYGAAADAYECAHMRPKQKVARADVYRAKGRGKPAEVYHKFLAKRNIVPAVGPRLILQDLFFRPGKS